MIYLYDGTYDGFLTCVFESFERKDFDAKVACKDGYIGSIFDETYEVITDFEKSARVQKGLSKKAGKLLAKDFFRVFLYEDPSTLDSLFTLLQRVFKEGPKLMDNFGDQEVLNFHQALRKVSRERHRMQAFIRFQKSNDGMYFSVIEPDFNVLPLLITFFRNRYTDQDWLIYDIKRNYGMMYSKGGVEEVVLTMNQTDELQEGQAVMLEEDELYYQNLWKQYFKSTNIVQRKNMKLHLRHVPRRYWKYLVEKQ